MNREKTRKISSCLRFLLYGAAFPLLILATASGCRSDRADVGDAAQEFREEMLTKLTMYSDGLAPAMGKHNRHKVKSILRKLHAVHNPLDQERSISLAVLDTHGVTVATIAGAETTGAQNYGNYHIVSQVLHKRKPLQSTLYLQGGRKLFIICSPLLNSDRLVGVLIIGIDSEQLKQSGITEKEFMSLDFSTRAGGRP